MMTARLRVVFGVLAAALTLAGPAPSAQGNRGAVPQNPDDKTVIHVLNRLGFGPTPEDIDRDPAGRPSRPISTSSCIRNGFRIRPSPPGSPDSRRSANRPASSPEDVLPPGDDGAPPAAAPRGAGRHAGQSAAGRHPIAIAGTDGSDADAARTDGRIVAAEDAARRLQRASARGSARRLLVQPLQRVRRQGSGAPLPRPSTSATPSVRTCSGSSAICSAPPRRARRCCSISTTGRAPRRWMRPRRRT